MIGRVPVFNPGNPTDPASDFNGVHHRRPVQFRAVQPDPDPARALRRASSTSPAGARRQISSLNLRALYNHRNSRNQAAPLAAVRRSRRRQRQSARHHFDRRHQSVQSVRPDARSRHLQSSSAGASSRTGRAATTRRSTPSMSPATLDGDVPDVRQRLVLGRQPALGQERGRADGPRQHQCGQPRPCLRPGRGLHRACVPFNIFGGTGSITQPMLDFVAFTQIDSSEQELWDASATISGSLFESAWRSRRPRPRRRASRPERPASIPTRSWPLASVRHPGAADRRATIMSTRSSPNCGCRCSPNTDFFHRLELTGAARYSDYSTSGSTTTFSAGLNWEPIEDLLFRGSWAEGFRAPSIGELFGTPSRFDQGGFGSLLAGQHCTAEFPERCDGARQLHCRGRSLPTAATRS